MRLIPMTLAGVFIIAHTVFYSCHDHEDHHHHQEDVSVSITGDSGTSFDAFFEDDDRSHVVSGTVPFDADFYDQEGFFSAQVDKDSAGAERLCVEIVSSASSKKSCTSAPFGRVIVTVVF